MDRVSGGWGEQNSPNYKNFSVQAGWTSDVDYRPVATLPAILEGLMKSSRVRVLSLGIGALLALGNADRALSAGVTAGSSSLFTTPDYTDTFTGTDVGGIPGRPFIAQGLPAYQIENRHGNPSTNYIHQPGSAFSIASDLGPGCNRSRSGNWSWFGGVV